MIEKSYNVQAIWSRIRGYNCFGCAPHNEHGLRLSFVETEFGISASFVLRGSYSSFPGVVHCGVTAAILEEVMGNLLVIKASRLCFTRKLSVKYLAPILVGRQYTAHAKLERADGDYYEIEAGIFERDDEILVAANGHYKAISPQEAMGAMDIDESTMKEFITYLRNDTNGQQS